MKQLKRMKLQEKADLLSDQEMKMILGGYHSMSCTYEHSGGATTTSCFLSVNSAYALCDFWWTAGYACRCHTCY